MLITTHHFCWNVGSEQNEISLVRSNENIFVQNQPTGQFEYFCQNQQNGFFFCQTRNYVILLIKIKLLFKFKLVKNLTLFVFYPYVIFIVTAAMLVGGCDFLTYSYYKDHSG